MAKGDKLGELEALVLAALVRLGSEANGTSAYEEIERRARRDPGVAGVHVTLRRLEEKGLVESRVGSRSPRGGRPRRFYSPTPDGLEALRTFRDMWERMLGDVTIPGTEGAS